MADLVYNAAVRTIMTTFFGSGTFKALLTTVDYAPDQDVDDFRNDVTDEITGTGYTAGGVTMPVTVEAVDTANNFIDVTFGPVDFTGLTADGIRQVVVYKALGGASSADPIIYCQDFDTDANLISGTFTIEATTMRFAVGAPA